MSSINDADNNQLQFSTQDTTYQYHPLPPPVSSSYGRHAEFAAMSSCYSNLPSQESTFDTFPHASAIIKKSKKESSGNNKFDPNNNQEFPELCSKFNDVRLPSDTAAITRGPESQENYYTGNFVQFHERVKIRRSPSHVQVGIDKYRKRQDK
jgi:hypothetical protein